MKLPKLMVVVAMLGAGLTAARAGGDSCCADGGKCAKVAVTRKGAELLAQTRCAGGAKTAERPPLPTEPPRELTAQEVKLADLAMAYRAELLTPAQYQKERARILSEK